VVNFYALKARLYDEARRKILRFYPSST